MPRVHPLPRPAPDGRPVRLGLAAALLILCGCPDPNPTGSYTAEGATEGAASGAAGGAGGAAPPPGGTRPDDARFKLGPDEGVAMGGMLSYAGDKTGRLQLDFLTRDPDQPPRLVHTVQLKGPGPWTTRVPKDYGPIYVVAFIDIDGDGPSATDPAAATLEPVVVGAEDLTTVDLTLSDAPDLGELTPGGGGKPPQPEGPPADGAPSPDAAPAPEGAPGGTPPAGEGAAPAPADGAPADAAPPSP
jgi:hypothetical protein